MKVLFVCTGNTCRSPMAEVLFAHLLKESGREGIEVTSAGISAYPGMPASSDSVRVMEEYDLSVRDHRARLLTHDLVGEAGLILCMGFSHLRAVLALGAGEKARLLSDYAAGESREIEDPYGRGIAAYRSCAAQLHAYLSQAARIV